MCFVISEKAEYSVRERKVTCQTENSGLEWWERCHGATLYHLIRYKNKMWQVPGGVRPLRSNGSSLCSSSPPSGHRWVCHCPMWPSSAGERGGEAGLLWQAPPQVLRRPSSSCKTKSLCYHLNLKNFFLPCISCYPGLYYPRQTLLQLWM